MKLIKCSDRNEIFELEDNTKHWVEDWDTFLYYANKLKVPYYELLDSVNIIPFDELRSYKVGDTKKVTTVTQIIKGKDPDMIFYPDEPEVTIRKMAILGTCLIRCERMWADLNGTHVIANRPGFTDNEALWQIYEDYKQGKRENFVKVIYNLRMPDASILTKEWVKEQVEEKMEWPIVGGWWCDNGIRGEEPDAQPWTPEYAEKQLQLRQWLYSEVRGIDSDIINRPFTEQFDMTEQGVVKGHYRSGWKGQWSEKPRTCDIVLIDTYPFDESDEVMREQLTDAFVKFPKKHCRNTQVIGQINACEFRPGSIWIAYRVWKELINSPDFDNPYKGNIALAFYKDEYVRRNEEMQQEIKEVNIEIMRG